MTSNIGSEEFNEKAEQIGFSISEKEEAKIIADYDTIKNKVVKSLSDVFAPEFLNRIDKTVVFRPIDKKVLKKIIVLELDMLEKRLSEIGIKFKYDTKAVQTMLESTYNPEYGARPVRRYIQDSIEDVIADSLIKDAKKRTVDVSSDKK